MDQHLSSDVMHAAGAVIMRRACEASKAVYDRVIEAENRYVICPATESFDHAEWERGHGLQVEAARMRRAGL